MVAMSERFYSRYLLRLLLLLLLLTMMTTIYWLVVRHGPSVVIAGIT